MTLRWSSSLVLALLTLTAAAQTQDVEVVEFCPAPGQYVNVLPEAEDGDTEATICQKATEQLRRGRLLHLGAFGGYVTMRFDHAVTNGPGSDFRLTGNAFYAEDDPQYGETTIGGSIEPGIVSVGVGDSPQTAKWYELAGSEYYTREVHDFTITYHRPTAESGSHSLPASSYDEYIRWEATWTEQGVRRDSTGWHQKNTWHQQTYWPLWESADELTFRGGRLPDNAVEQAGDGSYWVQYRYAADDYGYADAAPKDSDRTTFDLDWAVDGLGRYVALDHADFIRVHTAVLQYCGWLGETSTEVASLVDLHLIDGYDDNPIIITPRPTAVQPTILTVGNDNAYYNLLGQRVASPRRGSVYILRGRKVVY